MEYCKSQQGTVSKEIEKIAYISVSTIGKRFFNFLHLEKDVSKISKIREFCRYTRKLLCNRTRNHWFKRKLDSKWSESSESLWVIASGTGSTMHMQWLCYADMSFDVHLLTSFSTNQVYLRIVYRRWQVLLKNRAGLGLRPWRPY